MRILVGVVLLGVVAGCLGEADMATRQGSPADPDARPALPEATPPSFPLAEPAVIARRLARLLWATEADEVWRPLAEGELSTPGAVGALAERMLGDPRAQAGVGAFFRHWLLLGVLPELEKADPDGVLDPELRRSMTGEAPALGAHLTLDDDRRGTFEELLTGRETFVDERLARHYGIAGVSGPEYRRVPFPAGQNRIGILSGAGVLSVFASLASPSWPAKRGWLVSEQMLCQKLPSGFLPSDPPDRARSIREQMLTLTGNGTCGGCHRYLDGPGLAFIGFDSFGRWRPEAGHGPGETRGWLPAEVLADRPTYDDLPGLARLLAGRPEVRRCFVKHWLGYAIDRDPLAPEATADDGDATGAPASSVDQIHADFQRAGFQLRALLVGITRSEAFLRPATP